MNYSSYKSKSLLKKITKISQMSKRSMSKKDIERQLFDNLKGTLNFKSLKQLKKRSKFEITQSKSVSIRRVLAEDSSKLSMMGIGGSSQDNAFLSKQSQQVVSNLSEELNDHKKVEKSDDEENPLHKDSFFDEDDDEVSEFNKFILQNTYVENLRQFCHKTSTLYSDNRSGFTIRTQQTFQSNKSLKQDRHVDDELEEESQLQHSSLKNLEKSSQLAIVNPDQKIENLQQEASILNTQKSNEIKLDKEVIR